MLIEIMSDPAFFLQLILDVNTEIYPIDYGQKLTLALARTLNLDGTPDEGG